MGEWKKEKLGILGYTYTGLSGKSAADFGEGAPYIPYMNVFTNNIIDGEFLEYVKVGKRENQNEVKLGDALFTTSSETPEEVGMSSVLTKDLGTLYLNSFCFGYRLYDKSAFDSTFLAYLLRSNSVRQQMFISAQGSTRHNLSKKNFNTTEVFYPPIVAEQSKIAEVLATVDKAIDKTRALIEKYKNIKAGMIQDLLGSGDEVPLSQLCQITSGSTPATSDPSYWDGHNVWITPNDLSGITTPFINTSARKLTDSGVKKATRVLLPPNSVIISNRAPVGYCAIVTVPFTFNQGCKGLVCNPDTDPLYLYYYLSKSKSQLERVSSGTTFLELPKKELNRFLIRIPKTINEQQAISEQILAADERIQTERDYLAKLQDIKLGLMQDLLTNTVSVNALL